MHEDQYNDNTEYALRGVCDPVFARSAEFAEWLAVAENAELFRELSLAGEAAAAEAKERDVAAIWNRFDRETIVCANAHRHSSRRQIWYMAGAASVVAALAAAFLFTETGGRNSQEPQFAALTDPQEIVLHIDGRQAVVLDEGRIYGSSEDVATVAAIETIISANLGGDAAGAFPANTYKLSVPRGKTLRFALDDGTEVWLNAESELSFPRNFAADRREVSLKGEGYFKVVHDEERPFTVRSAYFNTTVLGTRFNVRSYEMESAGVTLVEGSVRVGRDDANGVVIRPGEQAVPDSDGGFTVRKADVSQYTAWMSGFFNFDNTTLDDMMREAGRWYNLNIVFADEAAQSLKVRFWGSREASPQAFADMLNDLGKIRASIDGNTLTIHIK